ncbi:MAG: flagellar hook-associated protein FlgK [Burkholderiales bacterium]
MSTSSLMNLGTRAMFAAQAQLSTTSHNISNASVAGYSRQETQLTTSDGLYTGAGFFGRGVTVQSVTRAVNSYLTMIAAQTGSTAAGDQARSAKLSQLESAFGTGENGLGYAATQLLNAFADVAAHPDDLSARQVVLSRASELASQFRSTSDQVESLQASVKSDVAAGVDNVNEMAKRVATLNQQIAQMQGTGHTPNDLLDQRDQLVAQISQQVQVTRLEQDDGSLSLFVGGGQSLVLSSTAYQLKMVDDPFDSSRVGVAINVAGQDRLLSADALGGGAISGMVRFQDDDLAAMRAQLGRLAATLGDAVNQRQSLGLDLSGAAGSALFSYANSATLPAVTLPANTNAKDGAGAFIGSVSIAVTDAKALQASEYELRNDPASPGQYQVTRLSDGKVTSGLNSGDTLDGFTLTIGAAPAAGDKYLLQPVSTAAQSLTLAQTDPRSLAAANPLSVTAAGSNRGTAATGSFTMVATPATPYGAMNLVFTSGTGDYELRDSGGAVLNAGTWNPGAAIAYDGFELRLSGAPQAGDSFAIAATADVRTSNGNALSFVDISNAAIVGESSFTDAFANTLADLGTRVQGALSAADISATTASSAQQALGAETGVNLDEEAARLIQYQQSYQAAAKILQVAQKVFDTILSLGG